MDEQRNTRMKRVCDCLYFLLRSRTINDHERAYIGEFSCAWIESSCEVVQRDVQHGGIFHEDILRAIAMMHVPVDNGHALNAPTRMTLS